MSDITLPHPTFTDGNTLVSDDVWENFYTAEAVPNSLEVINGGLEVANVLAPSSNYITTPLIQTGAMSSGKGVGATANVDYFPEPFSDWVDDATPSVDIDSYYQAIPGASIEFFLPYAPSVLVATWQITGVVLYNNQSGTEFNGRLRLFMDGVRVSDNVAMVFPDSGAGPEGRSWQGHYMKIGGLTKGWHSLSLRIVADKDPSNQIRVHTRNMNYVYFQ
tara:strand:+ start:2989 stop:3645 length:657 start_codon:yes stop_codon:yes gene_type:complete